MFCFDSFISRGFSFCGFVPARAAARSLPAHLLHLTCVLLLSCTPLAFADLCSLATGGELPEVCKTVHETPIAVFVLKEQYQNQ